MTSQQKQDLLNGKVNNEAAKLSGEWIENGEKTIIHDWDNGCQARINTTTGKHRFFYPSGKEIKDGRTAFKHFLTNFGVPYIRSNYNWREFISSMELTQEEKEDYDHLFDGDYDQYIDEFFRYNDRLFHTSDFVRFDSAFGSIPKSLFPGFHGYSPSGYGYGYVIALSECGEAYKIGYYF